MKSRRPGLVAGTKRSLVIATVVLAMVAGWVGPAHAGIDTGSPGIVVTAGQNTTFQSLGEFRIRGLGSTPTAVWINAVDAGVATRTSGSCTLSKGTAAAPKANALSFTWNRSADTLTSVITNTESSPATCTVVYTGFTAKLAAAMGISVAAAEAALSGVNALQILTDNRTSGPGVIQLANGQVDGSAALGTFTSSQGAQTFWTATDYDFSSPNGFSLSGTLNLGGSFANGESSKLAVQFGRVAKSSQGITFTSASPVGAAVGGTYQVAATASSGLPVSYSVGAGSACTLSGTTVTFTAVGTCVVRADQPGNVSFDAAPQVQQSFSIAKAAVVVELVSSSPAPVFGQLVDLKVKVRAVDAAAGTPTGIVTFTDSTGQRATTIVLNQFGQQTLARRLALGAHDFVATYSGDSRFAPGSSAAVSVPVTPATTTVGLSASPREALAGQPVKLTAVVRPAHFAAGYVRGSVTFKDGGTIIKKVSVNALTGVATVNLKGLAVGSHEITATYSGTPGLIGATSAPVTVTVTVLV